MKDRWAAFTLAARRADVPRSQGDHHQAAALVEEALAYVPQPIDPATLPYHRAFLLLHALEYLVSDLTRIRAGARVGHYGRMMTDLARDLHTAQPGEPDFARALSRLVLDGSESAAILEELAAADPLPWRVEEAARARAEAGPPGTLRARPLKH